MDKAPVFGTGNGSSILSERTWGKIELEAWPSG